MAYRPHKLKVKLDHGGEMAREAVETIAQRYQENDCQFTKTAAALATTVPTLRRWMRTYPEIQPALAKAKVRWAQSELENFN